jgi:tetrachloro-p-hydroquinone reductive dehalogenase
MNKLVLYHYPMSLCSQKVRLCLAELGLSYEPRSVDIGFGVENFEPWYVRLNPAGVVPTLCDGERIVTNSARILRYLAIRAGSGLPSDARQRAAAEHWLAVADAIPLHAISYSRGAIPRGDELLEMRLQRIVELRKSNLDLGEVYDALYARVSKLRDTAHLYKDSGKAVDELNARLNDLEQALLKSTFIVGGSYSIADMIWTVTLARIDMLGMHEQLASHPQVASYYERVTQRASFAAASIQRRWTGGI